MGVAGRVLLKSPEILVAYALATEVLALVWGITRKFPQFKTFYYSHTNRLSSLSERSIDLHNPSD
jgi:hypothetical protein